MSEWADEVKRKIDLFNSRRGEIDDCLEALIGELKSPPYNLHADCNLVNKQDLIWEVKIGAQTFTISEKEISERQVVVEADEFGDIVNTGERKSVKEALQGLIIEKLKSF